MAPFTVRPAKRTPAGTRTRNSTFTSLSRVFMRPPLPGLHSLGAPSRDGYTEQMVTPPECSTTLISTSSGLLRRPRFTAVTSTSPPEAGSASIPPLTPLTAMVAPDATFPCQWKSSARRAGATRAAARTARVAAWRVFIIPPFIDPPPCPSPRRGEGTLLLGGLRRLLLFAQADAAGEGLHVHLGSAPADAEAQLLLGRPAALAGGGGSQVVVDAAAEARGREIGPDARREGQLHGATHRLRVQGAFLREGALEAQAPRAGLQVHLGPASAPHLEGAVHRGGFQLAAGVADGHRPVHGLGLDPARGLRDLHRPVPRLEVHVLDAPGEVDRPVDGFRLDGARDPGDRDRGLEAVDLQPAARGDLDVEVGVDAVGIALRLHRDLVLLPSGHPDGAGHVLDVDRAVGRGGAVLVDRALGGGGRRQDSQEEYGCRPHVRLPSSEFHARGSSRAAPRDGACPPSCGGRTPASG